MGGVNLAEESQRILASSGELLQTDTRTLHESPLLLLSRCVIGDRMRLKWSKCIGTDNVAHAHVHEQAMVLLDTAVTQMLHRLLRRLNVLAEHRADPIRVSALVLGCCCCCCYVFTFVYVLVL